MTPKPAEFQWHSKRKKAALLLSRGTYTQAQTAKEVQVNPHTVSDWCNTPIFKKEVDRLTLEHELATRTGLMRLAFKAVDKTKSNLADDKNTTLDWAKFITDLLPEDTKQSDDKLKELTDAILASSKKGD